MTTIHKINSPAWKKLIVTKREEKNNPATIKNKNPIEHELDDKIELRIKTIEQSVNLILKKLDRIEKSNNTEIA
tara:strand:+ start:5935 stop:6156 length:222 start_codon:yes stop_codon:yes gene_type:complete